MNKRFANISLLKQDAENQQYNSKREPWKMLLRLLARTQSFVSDEQVDVVYPKRLLGDDEDKQWNGSNLEVILFTKDDRIVVARVIDDGQGFQVGLYQKANISSVHVRGQITDYRDDVKHEALIHFKDGSELVLSSEDDANESWQRDYSELIVSIVQLLM